MRSVPGKMWAYSHRDGWYQIDDFLSAYSEAHGTDSPIEDLIGCNYAKFSGFYYLPEPSGGNILKVHRILELDESKPEFIVEVSFAASDMDFIAAKELPDAIEILNKLAPIAHAAVVAEEVTKKNKYRLTSLH